MGSPVKIFRPPASRGPTGYGICPRPGGARPASAGSNSTRSGSRPSSPGSPDIFASPKTPRPRYVRNHRGLRFETTDRFAPDEPFWGTVKRRPASARRAESSLQTQAEPSNQQLLEIVPAEVREKVKSTAGSRGALVIEMLWSSSSYLPAHDNGRKYISMASELVDLMAGRLSNGEPFRVLTIEEPVNVKKGLYDKFSERERTSGALASNVSHANGTASRVGAFEVHLLQDVWNAKLCSASANHHQGPPVITSDGILCAACAASSAGGLAGEQMQHLLLHSKLWTRRWPSLLGVLALTAALVIEAPPEVPQPAVIRPVTFQRCKCPELRRSSSIFFQPKDVSLPEDPKRELKREIQKRLDDLGCECQQEWFVATGAGNILSTCGKNCHKLEIQDVLPLLVDTARLKEDEFRNFVKCKSSEWSAQPLSDFIFHFVDESMHLVRHRNRHDYARYDRQVLRREQEKEKRVEVASEIRRTRRRSTTVVLEYQIRFEEGQDRAEQIFVSLCVHLIRKVPRHGLTLQRLEEGLADASEAQKLLQQALRINELRRKRWETWYQTLDSWKRDDTEKEKELFSTILSHRKDLRDASMAREQDGDMETRLSRLETEIESFYSRIRQTFVKPNEHQQDIDELERQVDRAQTEYIEIVEA